MAEWIERQAREDTPKVKENWADILKKSEERKALFLKENEPRILEWEASVAGKKFIELEKKRDEEFKKIEKFKKVDVTRKKTEAKERERKALWDASDEALNLREIEYTSSLQKREHRKAALAAAPPRPQTVEATLEFLVTNLESKITLKQDPSKELKEVFNKIIQLDIVDNTYDSYKALIDKTIELVKHYREKNINLNIFTPYERNFFYEIKRVLREAREAKRKDTSIERALIKEYILNRGYVPRTSRRGGGNLEEVDYETEENIHEYQRIMINFEDAIYNYSNMDKTPITELDIGYTRLFILYFIFIQVTRYEHDKGVRHFINYLAKTHDFNSETLYVLGHYQYFEFSQADIEYFHSFFLQQYLEILNNFTDEFLEYNGELYPIDFTTYYAGLDPDDVNDAINNCIYNLTDMYSVYLDKLWNTPWVIPEDINQGYFNKKQYAEYLKYKIRKEKDKHKVLDKTDKVSEKTHKDSDNEKSFIYFIERYGETSSQFLRYIRKSKHFDDDNIKMMYFFNCFFFYGFGHSYTIDAMEQIIYQRLGSAIRDTLVSTLHAMYSAVGFIEYNDKYPPGINYPGFMYSFKKVKKGGSVSEISKSRISIGQYSNTNKKWIDVPKKELERRLDTAEVSGIIVYNQFLSELLKRLTLRDINNKQFKKEETIRGIMSGEGAVFRPGDRHKTWLGKWFSNHNWSTPWNGPGKSKSRPGKSKSGGSGNRHTVNINVQNKTQKTRIKKNKMRLRTRKNKK